MRRAGGAPLARSFRRADEIDSIRLPPVPILLGDGIPLFPGSDDERELRLIDAITRDSGIVELQYERLDRDGDRCAGVEN